MRLMASGSTGTGSGPAASMVIGCVVTVCPAPPGAGPPNPVLGLPAIAGEPADSLLDHLTDEHGIGTDTGRFVLHAQGVSGLVKEHDLDHTENSADQLGHAHPSTW
jgi:hypothetical protein